MTHPTAILAAAGVWSSFHAVSESTPIPLQGSRTKLLIGRLDSGKRVSSKRCRLSGFVPIIIYQYVSHFLTNHSAQFAILMLTKQECVCFTVTRLYFFKSGFSRTYPLAHSNETSFLNYKKSQLSISDPQCSREQILILPAALPRCFAIYQDVRDVESCRRTDTGASTLNCRKPIQFHQAWFRVALCPVENLDLTQPGD